MATWMPWPNSKGKPFCSWRENPWEPHDVILRPWLSQVMNPQRWITTSPCRPTWFQDGLRTSDVTFICKLSINNIQRHWVKQIVNRSKSSPHFNQCTFGRKRKKVSICDMWPVIGAFLSMACGACTPLMLKRTYMFGNNTYLAGTSLLVPAGQWSHILPQSWLRSKRVEVLDSPQFRPVSYLKRGAEQSTNVSEICSVFNSKWVKC